MFNRISLMSLLGAVCCLAPKFLQAVDTSFPVYLKTIKPQSIEKFWFQVKNYYRYK